MPQAESQKNSIGRSLIFYLALLIALISGLASVLNYTFYTTKLVRDFETQYRDDVDYLANLLTVPLWNYEFKAVESICQSFLKREGTLAVTILLDNQQKLTYNRNPADLKTANQLTREIRHEGSTLATLTIYYTTKDILRAARNSQLKFLLTILLVIALTSIALTLIVKRLITRPFALLEKNMLAISAGNFAPLDIEFKHREAQNIADAFNYMCSELLTREEEILQKGQFLQTIINAMPSPLLILDHKLAITQFNAATETFFNQLGLRVERDLTASDVALLQNYREQISRVLASRKPIQLNKECLSSLAGEVYVNILFFPIVYQQETNVAIRIDDITSLEHQSNALLQAQKMEVVGTLAGGLAHDFNNVLGIITGSISLLELKVQNGQLEPDAVNKQIDRIKVANDRAIQMIQQLLMLAKQHHMEKKFIDLQSVVSNCLELGAATFDKSIKIDFQRSEQEKTCYGDSAKLEQALLNLLLNASHAMTLMRGKGETWGGTLAISIEKLVADEFFLRDYPEAQKNSYWLIAVSDTGVGIPHKALDKIFDPFFSTKEGSKGTGLGLSMVRNIISSHEGFIKVYSEAGVGTTFNVYLPVAKQAADVHVHAEKLELRTLAGTILLVDDEPEIRATGKEMLEFLGIKVVEAENGLLAIEQYKEHRAEIDLILMDLVMPLRSGREAAEEILAFNPQARIIMSSGFRKDFRISEAMQIGACDFLHKPYSLEHLYQMLAKYLPTRSR